MHYCTNGISRIRCFEISSTSLKATRAQMSKRFQLGSTIAGTRSFYYFTPFATNQVGCRFISLNLRFYAKFTFVDVPTALQVQPINFAVCLYNFQWWIVTVLKVNNCEQDTEVKLMHPCGPTTLVCLPIHEDVCNISYTGILCKVDASHQSAKVGETTNFRLVILTRYWKNFMLVNI